MKDNAVKSGDISLRRAVRDWRDWWEIETELFLTMASKALFLDLSDIHDSYSVLRKFIYGSDHEARAEVVVTDWAAYVTRHLPVAARLELTFLLRNEHAPEPVIENLQAYDFSWVDAPVFSRFREEVCKGGSELREAVRLAVLGEETDNDREEMSLRAAVLDYLVKLEAIALEED